MEQNYLAIFGRTYDSEVSIPRIRLEGYMESLIDEGILKKNECNFGNHFLISYNRKLEDPQNKAPVKFFGKDGRLYKLLQDHLLTTKDQNHNPKQGFFFIYRSLILNEPLLNERLPLLKDRYDEHFNYAIYPLEDKPI